MSHAELASSYAALILADDGVDITVSLDRERIPGIATAMGRGRRATFDAPGG